MFVDKFADVRVSCASRSWRMADAITRESRLLGAVLEPHSGAGPGKCFDGAGLQHRKTRSACTSFMNHQSISIVTVQNIWISYMSLFHTKL